MTSVPGNRAGIQVAVVFVLVVRGLCLLGGLPFATPGTGVVSVTTGIRVAPRMGRRPEGWQQARAQGGNAALRRDQQDGPSPLGAGKGPVLCESDQVLCAAGGFRLGRATGAGPLGNRNLNRV